MELEANLRKQFGIKDCCVILRDIRSSLSKGISIILGNFKKYKFIHLLFLPVMNLENADLLPSKEANQIVDNGNLKINKLLMNIYTEY